MSQRGVYRIILAIVTVILLVVGIYIGKRISKNVEQPSTAQVLSNSDLTNNTTNNNQVNIYDQKQDIELIYEDYYKLDDKTVTNSTMVSGLSMNDLKAQEEQKIKTNNSGYDLVEQTSISLRYRRTLDQYSPNHYLVRLVNGKVVIYNMVSDSVTTVYKQTDISESSIRPELVEELNMGKRVDSKEELNSLLEDLYS